MRGVNPASEITFDLESTFPFEGNWNSLKYLLIVWRPPFLESTFPFEGNWNLAYISPYMWGDVVDLGIHFPVWRELKRIRHGPCKLPHAMPWNPLSRLKGIETSLSVLSPRISCNLGIHFPVWRELKPNYEMRFPFLMCAWNPLSRLKGIETFLHLFPSHPLPNRRLGIHFPVWRELKPSEQTAWTQ